MRLSAILIAAIIVLGIPQKTMAQYMDCVVRSGSPFEVHSDDGTVSELRNGDRIFPPVGDDNPDTLRANKVVDGSLREVGSIDRRLVECTETNRSHSYPYVLTDRADLRNFGLTIIFYGGGTDPEPFGNHCFEYGDGGYDMTVSDDVLARHRGIPFDNLCLALRQGGLRYDPDTGRRLPTYILANVEALKKPDEALDPGVVSEELPLAVPRCFAVGEIDRDATYTLLKNTGCSYKYHPWSGRRLTEDESAALAEAGLSIDGAAAPGTPPEASRVALDRRHWITGAQAETLGRR
jgi:hypothetical protein